MTHRPVQPTFPRTTSTTTGIANTNNNDVSIENYLRQIGAQRVVCVHYERLAPSEMKWIQDSIARSNTEVFFYEIEHCTVGFKRDLLTRYNVRYGVASPQLVPLQDARGSQFSVRTSHAFYISPWMQQVPLTAKQSVTNWLNATLQWKEDNGLGVDSDAVTTKVRITSDGGIFGMLNMNLFLPQ